MDTQPLPQPQPFPQPKYDPDEKMVRDFLWLIEQGCNFRVYRRFGLEITLRVTRPGRHGIFAAVNLRDPKKSFAELLQEVRRLHSILP